jgi:hypothetical protein
VIHRQKRQSLAEVIVQFSRQPGALLFLRLHQPPAQVRQRADALPD